MPKPLTASAIILLLVSLVLLASCDLTDTSTTDSSPTAAQAPTKSSTHTTPAPAKPPKPTSTPGPRPITAAIFGGLIDAFTAKYGQPDAAGDYFYTLANGTKVDLLVIDEVGRTVPVGANDGQSHATLVQVSPDDTQITWPDDTCKQVLYAFMPPDAKYVKDIDIVTVEHVYVSASLAATFPAAAFVDASGNPLPPGTFYTTFQGAFATNGGCYMSFGE